MTDRTIMLLCVLIWLICAVGCAPGAGLSASPEWKAWSRSEGGILRGAESAEHRARVESLLVGLETLAGTQPVSVQILSNPHIRAWGWEDGTLFVTHGMLQRLDDNELSAALAHELAHFLDSDLDSDLDSNSAQVDGDGIEWRADEDGSRLLIAAGKPASAMSSMLRKLAADVPAAHAQAIRDRIARLDAVRAAND